MLCDMNACICAGGRDVYKRQVYTLAASAASRRAVRSAMRALKSDTTPIVSCILFCASWMEARASDNPV